MLSHTGNSDCAQPLCDQDDEADRRGGMLDHADVSTCEPLKCLWQSYLDSPLVFEEQNTP